MKADDVTGLILTGGRSRRFGQDKAGFVVEGRPMVGHVYRALCAVTDQLLLSVRDPDDRFEIAAPIVVDHYRGSGPLAGIHAGMTAAATSWVLVLACDMPFITPTVLRQLVDARERENAAVVARTPDGRTQPLCACYHVELLPIVESRLASDLLSMHGFLDVLSRIRFVDVPGTALRNVNTPVDFRR